MTRLEEQLQLMQDIIAICGRTPANEADIEWLRHKIIQEKLKNKKNRRRDRR